MTLTVLVANDTYDLTTLARIKRELKITDVNSDDLLTDMIHEESESFASSCGRVLAQETVRETFELAHWGQWDNQTRLGRQEVGLILARYPVTEIASVTLDGTTIGASELRLEGEMGILRRIRTDGRSIMWRGTLATVEYTGGYELLGTLPRRIERAVLTMLRGRWFSAKRDPALRSENVVGVLSQTWGAGSTGAGQELPPEVSDTVTYYKDFRFA